MFHTFTLPGTPKRRPREEVEAGINHRRNDDEQIKTVQTEKRLKHNGLSMIFVPQLEVEVHRVSNANR